MHTLISMRSTADQVALVHKHRHQHSWAHTHANTHLLVHLHILTTAGSSLVIRERKSETRKCDFFLFIFLRWPRKLCSANQALIYFSSTTLSGAALQPLIFHMKENV